MNILITGGTGFIGSRLALYYLEKGDAVKVLGQENNPAEAENRKLLEAGGAEVILSSVTDKDAVLEVLQGIDLVYHLAAAQHEANVPDQRFWDVNVTGTKNVLEASIQAGVQRFVHGSTIGVYGSALAGTLDEDSPLRPDNIYGVTKREGEKLVLSYREKLPVVVIRISETYGPGDRRLLKLFKAIKKNVFFIIGSGRNLHHLIYIDDLIEGLTLATAVEESRKRLFVLAGKEAITTNDMCAIIAEQLGTRIPKFRVPLGPVLALAAITEHVLRPLSIQPPLHRRRMDFFKKSFVFSQKNASEVTGFVPEWSFRDGVSETAQWYARQGYL